MISYVLTLFFRLGSFITFQISCALLHMYNLSMSLLMIKFTMQAKIWLNASSFLNFWKGNILHRFHGISFWQSVCARCVLLRFNDFSSFENLDFRRIFEMSLESWIVSRDHIFFPYRHISSKKLTKGSHKRREVTLQEYIFEIKLAVVSNSWHFFDREIYSRGLRIHFLFCLATSSYRMIL